MGSVINYDECPRCKQDGCFNEYYYKTGEEYITCPSCGYSRVFRYKRDDEGNFLKLDETKEFSFDNLIPEEIHIEDPYGAFKIEFNSGGATGGTLETEEMYQEFVEHIKSLTNQDPNIKEVVISKLVENKIEKEIIFTT